MIRASDLNGRAVVDVDAAEKLGRIDTVIIDPEARHLAGFRLTSGGSVFGNQTHTTLPATSVYAIGPDVITVRHATDHVEDAARFDRLPRINDVIGRKVVSREGRLLGVVDDVLISGADGRIVGYHLADSDFMSRLESLFLNRKHRRGPYIRADADVRAGRELIVVPEDSVSNWDEDSPKAAPVHP
jgi:uncharacterized protein YrrD